jgi:hypothetical protein
MIEAGFLLAAASWIKERSYSRRHRLASNALMMHYYLLHLSDLCCLPSALRNVGCSGKKQCLTSCGFQTNNGLAKSETDKCRHYFDALPAI